MLVPNRLRVCGLACVRSLFVVNIGCYLKVIVDTHLFHDCLRLHFAAYRYAANACLFGAVDHIACPSILIRHPTF